LGCKTLSTELKHSHLGGLYCQFGEAVAKRRKHGEMQLNLLELWTFSTISSQIALNALFMQVYHPLVLFMLYSPVAFVNFLWGFPEVSFFSKMKGTVLEPVHLLASFGSSVFGFGQWDPYAEMEQGNRPASHHCVAQILRISMMLVLMCVDLPAHGELSVPVPTFIENSTESLLLPVQTVIENSTDCLQELVHTWRNCSFSNSTCAGGLRQDFCPTLSGSSAYKALLQLMVVLGLPVYVVGMMVLLAVSSSFRTGNPNTEINVALTDTFSAVAQFLPEATDGDDHISAYHEISHESQTA